MSKRQPPRRPRTQQRRPAGNRNKQAPTPAQIAARLLDDLMEDLGDGDPMQAELAASYAAARHYPRFWHAIEIGRESDHPVHRSLAALAHAREDRHRHAALTLAHALDALTPDDDNTAAETITKLRFLRGQDPEWLSEGSVAELTSTLLMRDVFADELTLFVGVRHTEFEEHVVAVTMLMSSMPDIVEISIAGALEDVAENIGASLATEPDAADHVRLVEVGQDETAVLLLLALDQLHARGGEGLDEESLEYLALLEARARLFPHVGEDQEVDMVASSVESPLDDLELADIVDRFAEAAGSDLSTADAEDLVAWASVEVAGGVARVSPIVIEMYVQDLQEAGTGPNESQLRTIRAWVDFCASLTELPEDARQTVHEAIDELMVPQI